MSERIVALLLWSCLLSPLALAKEMDVLSQASAPSMRNIGGHQDGATLLNQQVDLTLADAVYLGLRNNRTIRSAYLDRVTQKYDLLVAEDTFNPKFSINGTYQANRGSADGVRNATLKPSSTLLTEYGTRLNLAWNQELSNANRAGYNRRDGLDLSIIQPLLKGAGWDVTTAPLRLARLNEQANRLNLKAGVAQTISAVISAYRDLLRAQEQLTIVEAALKRANALLDVNRALIAAGRMAEFEIVQTEADIATQELGVEDARNQVDSNRLSLLRLLALDLSARVRASDALQATQISIGRQEALRLAQIQQPNYLATLLGSQQADLNLVVAKSQGLWDVSLVAGANQVRNRYDNDSGNGSRRNWDSYAGVQVQIPIGDPKTRQQEVQARVAVEKQELTIAEARQELERNVNDVVRDLGTRWRQYEISQRAVELSRRKLEIEREKLSAGRSSNFQVLSYENDLRTSENARLNTLIAYLNAQTQLDLTLGTTLETWDIELNDF
ncbi:MULTISPECIES: TolC family protein [unclassified Pseudomonas]|uniref:TolC family protein n=1 Tax=unclassified Pseudomonas TaxID=196821 RepID=UPI00083939BE|nr:MULTISPECIES: TolC family protein [unclassified Pseudomonas]QIH08199.1 TolC family protein [Pseudomonas sp. BIOMIG1BAC]